MVCTLDELHNPLLVRYFAPGSFHSHHALSHDSSLTTAAKTIRARYETRPIRDHENLIDWTHYLTAYCLWLGRFIMH